jgi:hypothetical protein
MSPRHHGKQTKSNNCGAVILYWSQKHSSTHGNMMKHLASVQGTTVEVLTRQVAAVKGPKRGPMDNFFLKPAAKKSKKDIHKEQVLYTTLWVANTMTWISAVDNEHFQHMIKCFNSTAPAIGKLAVQKMIINIADELGMVQRLWCHIQMPRSRLRN